MRIKIFATLLSLVLVGGLIVPGAVVTHARNASPTTPAAEVTTTTPAASETAAKAGTTATSATAAPAANATTAAPAAVTTTAASATAATTTVAATAAPTTTTTTAAPTTVATTAAPTAVTTAAPTTVATTATAAPATKATTATAATTAVPATKATTPTTTTAAAPTTVATTAQQAAPAADSKATAQKLVARILAEKNPEALNNLLNGLSEQELSALTPEQQAQVKAHAQAVFGANQQTAVTLPAPQLPVFAYTNAAPFKKAHVRKRRAMPTDVPSGSSDNDNLFLTKTATPNGDGSYAITLKAFAIGASSVVTGNVPTDIVLVLDQSGSMGNQDFHTYAEIKNQTNQYLYKKLRNELNIKLDNGAYAPVTLEKKNRRTFQPVGNLGNKALWEMQGGGLFGTRQSFIYEKVGDSYYRISISKALFTSHFTYKLAEGEVESDENNKVPPFVNKLYFFKRSNETAYTYTYSNGSDEYMIPSNGGNTEQPRTFYRITSTQSRLEALKASLKTFVDQIHDKATADQVNHRVAVIGFGSGPDDYSNTEALVGSEQIGYDALKNDSWKYRQLFQNMNTANGYKNVTESIKHLEANGATRTDLGLQMAEKTFLANMSSDPAGSSQRNRVVVMFTDGVPTNFNQYDKTVAEDAIKYSREMQDRWRGVDGKVIGATVYAISVFPGANPLDPGKNNRGTDADKANWFMQNVSSNDGEVPAPGAPSYYLSANNTQQLSDIFDEISHNINTGTTVKLDEESQIRDIIAPSFQLPENATAGDIDVKMYKLVGSTQDGPIWDTTPAAPAEGRDPQVTIDENRNLIINGFSYKDNYAVEVPGINGAPSTYQGYELVIKFNVVPKPGFFGGNNVPTNGVDSGIYEKPNSDTPIKRFDVPKVDVPLADLTVTAKDLNFYYGNDTQRKQLFKSGKITVTSGGVSTEIDVTRANLGLKLEDQWKAAYVLFDKELYNGNGPVVTEAQVKGMKNDFTYKKVVIMRTIDGTPRQKDGTSNVAHVNIWTPKLVYNKGTVWYGGKIAQASESAYYDTLLNKVTWVHGRDTYNASNMNGTAPEVAKVYDPAQLGVKIGTDGIVRTKTNYQISATPKIGEQAFDATNVQVSVNTCELTITKSGNEVANEPFVFKIEKNGVNGTYTEASIVGTGSVTIKELPVGTYKVTENTGWSWRYTPAEALQSVTLNPQTSDGTLNFVNSKTSPNWLNDFSDVVKNVFGVAHN